MKGKFDNLTGQKFFRLTPIKRTDEVGSGRVMWLCKCDCGNETVVAANALKRGSIKSCGCYSYEIRHYRARKYNEYQIIGVLAYVKMTNTDNTMICDADDWEKLKQYCWHENKVNGYVRTHIDGKYVSFHSCLFEEKEGYVIDHINRNKLDNRRSNLRYASLHANALNISISKRNTSGYTGVIFDKSCNKWRAEITIDRKKKNLGRYEHIEDAIKARQRAEEELHKPILEKETLQTG